MKIKMVMILMISTLFLAGCGSALQMDRGSVQTVAMLEGDQYEITGEIQGEAEVAVVLMFFPIGQKPRYGMLNNPNGLGFSYGSSNVAESMAVYNALENSGDADMIIAPRYSMSVTGLPPFYWKTKVTVKGKGLKLK